MDREPAVRPHGIGNKGSAFHNRRAQPQANRRFAVHGPTAYRSGAAFIPNTSRKARVAA